MKRLPFFFLLLATLITSGFYGPLSASGSGYVTISGDENRALHRTVSEKELKQYIDFFKSETEAVSVQMLPRSGMDDAFLASGISGGIQAGFAGEDNGGSRSFMNTIAETPGLALLSSAILPGFGQAANRQWWKTAVFAGIEIGAVYLMFDLRSSGLSKQEDYNRYADEHWSVVQYAQFLTQYSQLDMNLEDVLTEQGRQQLHQDGFLRASFNNQIDWALVDLQKLNEYETQTIYRATGRPFSHVVPAYGSQQYYELVSKYFQYGPGWRDWNWDLSIVDGGVQDMPPSWQYHAILEEEFNDALRYSRNMGMLLIANHVFAAFDAFFTSRLRLHRQTIQTSASMSQDGSPQVHLSYKF